MTSQQEKAVLFASLHMKGNPLILFNIWDAGSAKIIEGIGAKALATGSWSVANAHGFGDGEKLPLDLVMANLERIVNTVQIPVSLDLEGGYGQSPEVVAASVARAIQAGAVGINFEDQIVSGEGLYAIETQTARIEAARQAADASSVPLFINARSDVFLKLAPEKHTDAHVEEAISRAKAYAQAGASGFMAPGLADANFIKKLCDASPIPVNIMTLPYTPAPKQMAALGVARISHGAGPYRQAMEALKAAGQQALSME